MKKSGLHGAACICLFVNILFLSGCGTLITVPIDSTPLSEDKATLIIYSKDRNQQEFDVYVDGKLVGKATTQEPLKIALEPGFHELNSESQIPFTIDRITIQEFDEGKTYYMKAWFELGMWANSTRIDPTYKIDSYEVMVPTKNLNNK